MKLVLATDKAAAHTLRLNIKNEEKSTFCNVIGIGAADADMNQVFESQAKDLWINERPTYVSPSGEFIWWMSLGGEARDIRTSNIGHQGL